MELLLLTKANVNAKDKNDQTPLHWAATKGREDVAELLLANKAVVDAKDKAGQTPLHYAVFGGHEDVEDLLRHHSRKDPGTTQTM